MKKDKNNTGLQVGDSIMFMDKDWPQILLGKYTNQDNIRVPASNEVFEWDQVAGILSTQRGRRTHIHPV